MVRVGWVVDCQRDFMEPDGRLYVKNLFDESDEGARRVEPALFRAVAWMREHCAAVVFTGDWHGYADAEIDTVAPDATAGTYPPHCMGRSPDADERAGAEVIEPIRPRDPLVLAWDAKADDGSAVAERAVDDDREVFIQKTRFDVFVGNEATEAFVRALVERLGGEVEFVVIGVARDVCVTQAVDGMQARGLETVAVSDATWGLGLEDEAVTLARWADGGRVVTLDELIG